MDARIQNISLAPFERVLAVSDIHGCPDALASLLTKAGFSSRDALVLVGDYVERGTASLPLLRRLMELSAQGNVFPLMGNCDNLIEDLFEPRFRGDMLRYLTKHTRTVLHEMLAEQGRPFSEGTTLEELRETVLAHYAPERDWLRRLPHIIDTERVTFVHAGLDAGPLNGQDDDRCLKRKDYFETAPVFHKQLVVGHMPCVRLTGDGSLGPVMDRTRNIAFIDGGAGVLENGMLHCLIVNGAGGNMPSVSVKVPL